MLSGETDYPPSENRIMWISAQDDTPVSIRCSTGDHYTDYIKTRINLHILLSSYKNFTSF